MLERFEIGPKTVGHESPTFVIAEAGANHNRDLDLARQLIDVAADAGADAVKFQTYSGERIYSTKAPRSKHFKEFGDLSPAELLERISLPREWQPLLAEHAQSRGVPFFSTPFDLEAVDELAAIGVPLMKISSFEIVDLALIERAAATGIPLIISTGMASMGEIDDALTAAQNAGAERVGLMQCTSLYPAPAGLVNLRAMQTLRTAFRVPVGLSDHTEGISVPIAASALGAAFIEKHFTLSRSLEGPDHGFALEPDELRAMVAGVREAQQALGDGRKAGPSPEESEEMYSLGRRSIIVKGDHAEGTELTAEMLTTKRPGFGIAPKHMDIVVGRLLRRPVEHDDVLTWDHL